jgi:predicted ATPase
VRSCDLPATKNDSDRLAFLRPRCVAGGLHLLEAPECAFAPSGQLALLSFLKTLVAENAQFIVVTHSPLLLAFPEAQILDFDAPEIRPCAYDEVSTVKLMREFLRDPEEQVRKL